MITLEQTTNECGFDQVGEAECGAASAQGGAVGIEGGVGKPGGFTNTNDDPRAGGTVVLPGGITNTSLSEERLQISEPDDEANYIPRIRCPGPYSRGGRPTVLTPPVKEEPCSFGN